MNRKRIFLIAFVLLVLTQLYVPGKMIWENEQVWSKGSTFKFKTAPVDPVDIFRGKYIDLYFQDNLIKVADESEWVIGEEIYGLLTLDDEGFSQVSRLVKEEPVNAKHYLKLEVNYVTHDGRNQLHIKYPFNRFYMEESKAYQAELSYNESRTDTTSTTYVLVNVLAGTAVIKDVLIDGIPIKEVAQASLDNTEP